MKKRITKTLLCVILIIGTVALSNVSVFAQGLDTLSVDTIKDTISGTTAKIPEGGFISGVSDTVLSEKFGITSPLQVSVEDALSDAFTFKTIEGVMAVSPETKYERAGELSEYLHANPLEMGPGKSGSGTGAGNDKALLGGSGEVTFDTDISTLDELKALFQNGGSGRLVANITADDVLTVENSVALSLNGYVLNLNDHHIEVVNAAFDLYDSGDTVHYFNTDSNGLYIWDGTDTEAEDKTAIYGGVICGGFDYNCGCVLITSGGSFTQYGGNIIGCMAQFGGAVLVDVGCYTMNGGMICGCLAPSYGAGVLNFDKFIMNGGEISQNTGRYGGGVFLYGGSFAMNGGLISGNDADSGGAVYNLQGSLVLNDGTIDGNTATAGAGVFLDAGTFSMTGGVISGGKESYSGVKTYGGAVYNHGGTFVLAGGKLSGNNAYCGGGVCNDTGDFSIVGGEISGNTAVQGGAVQFESGKFTVNAGTMSGNTATFGGAVFTFGDFVMEDGEMRGNIAMSSGGAIYSYQGAFTQNGGKIIGNQSGAGGAVFLDNAQLTMTGGEMSENSASQGGAVQIDSGKFTMKDGLLRENMANYGGSVLNSDEFIMDGGTILDGLAMQSGGAVYNLQSIFTMNGGSISGNRSAAGGGIYLDNATFTMKDGEITGSNSSQGGAVLISGGRFTMQGGKLQGNKANYGGGIMSAGFFVMEGGTIIGNTSSNSGGAVYGLRGSVTLTDGTVQGNKANAGAGVFVDTANTVINGGNFIDNTALFGGAVYVSGGTFDLNAGNLVGNLAEKAGGAIYVNGGTNTMNGGQIVGNASPQGGAMQIDKNMSFVMTDGLIGGNVGTHAGGVFNFGFFTMEGGTISLNESAFGGAVYNVGTLNLNTAEEKQIEISQNTAEGLFGAVVNLGTLNLSGKIIIKDNTAKQGFDNLCVLTPVNVTGLLTGSDIGTAHADADNEIYNAGVVTNGYSETNPDTEADEYFHYEGPNDFLMILNNGEVEIVPAAAKISDVSYLTLAEAVEAVEDNGTVVLLGDNAETVTVSKELRFVLDVNGFTFTGAVEAGDGYTVTFDEDANTYTFRHIHFKDTYHAAVDATCTTDGTAEYWDCGFAGCDADLDADGNVLESTAGDPATGHYGTLCEGADPTEKASGHKEYYACICGLFFEDEACSAEISDLEQWMAEGGNGYIAPLVHGTDENKDHKCDYCGDVISDCTDEDRNHVCDYCAKTVSECADEDSDHKCDVCGKILSECADTNCDHKCDVCGKILSACKDENKDHLCDICGKTVSGHTAVLCDGVEATLQSAGFKSYYKCECGKFFEDADCKNEITDLEKWKAKGGSGYLPKLEDPSNPKTDDITGLEFWAILFALSSMSISVCAVLRKKETF